MARKRGGLAGVWDRNKQYIKPIATLAAGALTGGVGGAVVGGLMNGLDRPGKGGIGFDVGKGALGAASGYGMGKIGGALKSGVMNRLASNGLAHASKALPGMPSMIGTTAGNGMPALSAAAPGAMANAAPGMLQQAGGMAQQAAPWFKDGKTISALGSTAVGAMNAYGQSQQNALQREQMERNNRIEDEDRENERGLDPVRARLLAMMMQRLGAGAPMGTPS
jgi:hypothetical protein